MEEVSIPIQILGQKIDRIIGQGSTKRAERLNLSLEFKIQLIAAILKAKIDMPRRDSESLHSSSDEILYTEKKYTSVEYKNKNEITISKTMTYLENLMSEEKTEPEKSFTHENKPM